MVSISEKFGNAAFDIWDKLDNGIKQNLFKYRSENSSLFVIKARRLGFDENLMEALDEIIDIEIVTSKRIVDDMSDMKSNHMPISTQKAVHIFRKITSQHAVAPTTNQWVSIPGIQQIITVDDHNTDVEVFIHFHGNTHAANRRLCVKVFIDDVACGIVDPNEYSGMALSHTPTWVPGIAIGSKVLSKGSHVICGKVKSGINNGIVNANACSMLVKIYPPVLNLKWMNVDLNDNSLLFDADAEYRIQLLGLHWMYPTSVSATQLTFVDNVTYECKRPLYSLSKVVANNKRIVGKREQEKVKPRFIVTSIQTRKAV